MNMNFAGGIGGSGDGINGGGNNNNGSPCGACKFLRRKCVAGCIFAPYFDSDQGASHFAAVHKVFGASNVSKLLLGIPMQRRLDAVVTICYEAQSRLRDPVYGCVGHVFALQQQLLALQAELAYLQGHLAAMELHHQAPVPPPPQAAIAAPPVFSIGDLPSAAAIAVTVATTSTMPANMDVSSLFDPSMGQSQWANRAVMDPRQYLASAQSGPIGGGVVDLQAVARELMHRHVTHAPGSQAQCSNAASSSQSHSSK